MSEEQPVFKVTDRRLFNPDGTPREIERAEETKPETAAAETKQPAPASEPRAAPPAREATQESAEPAPAAGSPAPPTQRDTGVGDATEATVESSANAGAAEQSAEDDYAESEIPGADDPASFINFLMSIASNAAAALGMMEHPVTGERRVDPELAKHWIDVLGMLQQKTRGNLAPQEQQIFEGLLADLRMQYVSLSGARQPKAPRGFTGSDITGGR
ncbi:MAG: hypothetical protein QOH25_2586 [Acidobacteriota bacterium]|jgi:hypothetical protein|nr:hypothetical protein [Acidobacteriota bacterium]